MPEDKSEEQQKIDEARAIHNARKTEIENNVSYLKMLGKSYEQEITEIEAEIERLKEYIKFLNKQALADTTPLSNLDTDKKWKKINKKYIDARKFYISITTKIYSKEIEVDTEIIVEIDKLYKELTDSYYYLNRILNNDYDNYKQLLKTYESETRANQKEKLKDKLEKKGRIIISAETVFNNRYQGLITFKPLEKEYKDFTRKELKEKFQEEEPGNIKRKHIVNSKERIDRVKLILYINKYKQSYLEGKPIPAPPFHGLESYYNKNGTIDPDKFPKFFKELTGVDFEHFDLENDIQTEELRQMLAQDEIDQLKGHELRQLKIDFVEENPYDQEEKNPLITYISDKEKEEKKEANTTKKKLSRYKKSVVDEVKRSTDPYLSKNPTVQKRAEMMHSIVYEDLLGKGNIRSLIRLTELPDLESMRPDIIPIFKEYAKEKFNEVTSIISNKVVEKIDKYEIGAKIRTKGKKVAISVIDKSKFVQKHRKQAKKQGLGLIMYIIKKIIERTVGRVVETVKTGYRVVRNSRTVVNTIESIKGTPLARGIQKFATAVSTPIKELVTKGRLVYSNVLKNPIVVGAMDAGYVAKTALKNAPKGLLYGAGVSSIALSVGVPIGSIIPVFVGGSLLGIGLGTVNDIMNSPTKRVLSGPLRWLQGQGSALYKDPVSKNFSPDLIKNSPGAQAGKTVNVMGTRAGRLFGAATSGLSAAMLAATLAGLVGINPLLAAGIAFGTVSTAKFIAQTVAGRKIAEHFINGTGLSKLGMLPLNRLLGHIFNTKIVTNLLQELISSMRAGRGFGDFFQKNFAFGSNESLAGKLNNFNILNNYLATIGYFGSYSYIIRTLFGSMLTARVTGMGISGLLGPSSQNSFLNIARGIYNARVGSTGILRALALGIRGAFAPTLILTASTIISLGIASFLGIAIGGIGATVGSVVGGLIGTGIGLALGVGVWSLPLAAGLNAVGTILGAWIGSFFDKTVDNLTKGLFGFISAIGFMFSLIDILQNKKLSLNRLAMLSLSLSLSLPALTAMIEKGSESQVQADPTKPTPTTVVSSYNDTHISSSLSVSNRTDYKLNENEVNKLASLIKSELIIASGINTHLIFSDSSESSAFIEDNTVTLILSVREQNPLEKTSILISNLGLTE